MTKRPDQTTEALIAQFGRREIPLEQVVERYWPQMSLEVARERAANCTLQVPAYRSYESRKAPFLIRADDLARYLDDRHARDLERWETLQAVQPASEQDAA